MDTKEILFALMKDHNGMITMFKAEEKGIRNKRSKEEMTERF